ncbi:tRNA (adenine(22)-N(1))-methyltransferase [Anaerocolumna xylanovorans]|uniref:tRNA (Adenine22-N1)-methyltransferase n=1 Tax=Anaerocolumna xylanovorans DSM 12503 TaxID=1121345 RepID=A0A1M7Y4J3_9FIRM|nr:class I SAM-dependent methyltransferase [Anaerocolumna xylanovorans]SHO47162.1 tRNA (adenine22-N1)-methyltransferase [Anaerocolumna xylanovorans DSM 12503]
MQLSNRLKTVADTVTKGNRVADVGCDHAYIAIYLAENNIAPKVIAMDVNIGPLSRANENIALWRLTGKIETRLSDGLLKLKPSEADSVVIAGMGGALIVKILKEGEESLLGVKELILQPQSEIFFLRRYLHEKCYEIQSEKMVKEDEKYYVIIKAVKADKAKAYEKDIFYLYGKLLLESREPVVKEYLEREMRLKSQVEAVLAEPATFGSAKRLAEIKEEISVVEEALKYFEE